MTARGDRLRCSRIPRVQLGNGLDCTKEKPTSVPTTREQSTLPFHPAVGRQGRWGTRMSQAGTTMSKLITKYPATALILIWLALVGAMCILPGPELGIAQHLVPD